MHARIIALIAFLFVPAVSSAAGTWTWLFYMEAEEETSAEMENACIAMIRSMITVDTPASVRVLVQTDRGKVMSEVIRQAYGDSTDRGGVRYELRKDSWKYSGNLLGEVNMGDPATLLDFVQWGMKEAPADRYVLVFKGHGSGTISWRGVGAVGSPLPGEVRLPGDQYVAFDPESNDILTLFEVARVLERMRDQRGKKLDLMVMDTCYGASLESLYQFRDVTEVMVGSESTTLISGFDFKESLAATATEPGIATEELARRMVKSFSDRNVGDEFIYGAYRTAPVDELAGALDRLSIQLIKAHRENSKATASRGYNFQDSRYFDADNLVEFWLDPRQDLAGVSNRWDVKRACIDFLEARRRCEISTWYKGKFYDYENKRPASGGLSVYWPKTDAWKNERAYYKELPLSRTTHWDDFQDEMHGTAATQP